MLYDNDKILDILENLSKLEIDSKEKYQYEDRKVPRVTEVIHAMIHEDGLMNWANSLGWKRISYRAFMNDASEKGTYSHLAIERYLKNGYVDIEEFGLQNSNVFNTVKNCMDAFFNWWKMMHLKYKEIEIVFLEETLIHRYYGGTCDCLLKVDGRYVLIDFKTSNHMSYNYNLQLAAYRKALKEIKNIDVDICMILRLDKASGEYEEFVLDMENKEHLEFIEECEQTFLLLLAAFRMRMYTTEKYYEIYGLEKYKK